MRINKKRTSRCPSCGEKIFLGDHPKVGQYLLCSVCDEKVEIIKLDPIVLDLLYVSDYSEYMDDYEIMDKYWKRAKI
jgi:DNA-directed RNA polymerase subunit RPC12/RpoP